MHPHKRLIVAGLFAAAVVLMALYVKNALSIPKAGYPRAENGVLDLSGWDFTRDGLISLAGDWEFYWEKLLTPEDFRSREHPQKTGLIRVPGLWNGYGVPVGEGLKKMSGEGYATYRAVVHTDGKDELLALKILSVGTSYRLWVNGKLLAYNGRVGRSAAESVPQSLPRLANFESRNGRIELVLQIANFTHSKGGIWAGIQMGTAGQIQALREKRIAAGLFLCGALVIMGIYHLTLFLLRSKDRAPLFLSLLCLLISARVSVTGENFLVSFLPGLSWDFIYATQYLGFYLAIPVLVQFIRILYPREIPRGPVAFAWVAGVLFSLTVVVAPAKVYSRFILSYEIYTIAVLLYIAFAVLGRALFRKREGAGLFLTGTIVLTLAAVNDVLRANNLIWGPYIIQFGLSIFMLSQTCVLSLRFLKALQAEEKIAAELKEALAEKARYELNPHFLFNSLASIRGAVSRDAPTARLMLTKLSTYCRMVISPGGPHNIPLGEELEKIRLYLDIEKIRFGDYLSIAMDAAHEALELSVPPMGLQPLVENAVKYGRRTAPDELVVMVQARREGSRLLLSVINSGRWVAETDHKPVSTGTGLRNLRNRLHSRYGENFRLTTRAEDGHVRVELDLPAESVPETVA
jgi:two-component system LytT family sensor kinase